MEGSRTVLSQVGARDYGDPIMKAFNTWTWPAGPKERLAFVLDNLGKKAEAEKAWDETLKLYPEAERWWRKEGSLK
jgi:hypothetical protein